MAEKPQPEYRPVPPAPVAAVSPAPREPDPAADSPMESEPKFVPAKRERRPPPADLDEPLVQVETGNEPPAPKV